MCSLFTSAIIRYLHRVTFYYLVSQKLTESEGMIFESKQVNWKQPFPAWNSFQYNRQLLGQITIKVLNSSVSKGYLQYIHIMPTLNANTWLVFSSPTKPNSLLLKDERWAPIYHQICVSLWSAAAAELASLVQFACHNRDLWKKLERMHGCQGGVLKPTWLEIYDDANTHLWSPLSFSL